MASAQDLYVTGLRNAHAMEHQAREMLERQIERLDKYPDLVARLRDHLRETREQIKRLDQLLDDQGTSSSTLKNMALAFGANLAAAGHAMADDEVLKNTFASSALESYEIAAYKSLIAMAEAAGIDASTILNKSLSEEKRMADWLQQNIEQVTQQYIDLEERAAA